MRASSEEVMRMCSEGLEGNRRSRASSEDIGGYEDV